VAALREPLVLGLKAQFVLHLLDFQRDGAHLNEEGGTAWRFCSSWRCSREASR
jgi:hypothetical protein